MASLLKALFGDEQGQLRQKIGAIYLLLILFNIGVWAWAFVAFHQYPLLMGTSLLAYSFGLRHAVDADHIAAIDNVTRKLMQEGKRPITVGLMFSLGHSTIVVLASAGIAATAMALQTKMAGFKEIGGLIGTLVSTFFLFAIAIMNLIILRSVVSAFRRVRRGEPYVEEDFDLLLADRGFLARLFRPLFRLITKSWHMYFLGFLFGLGFDTATEVGLLGISAAGAAQGMPIWSILVFPALFMAGMTLIDTTDSILMLGAYGWAFVKPIRKLYYNMTITTISVLVALLVGSIEGLGLLADKLKLSGGFWDAVGELNDNFGMIGYVIVGVFVISWLASVAYYRWQRLDELEVRSEQT
ncbi:MULTISPECIES: HoxN/HupN/NixA family nickel/cobalt transporter [Burkholderia cepacia complex]|uniref:HoxN/HupN/NixA family nickel/cobalt transporter n=1 Tax=Burkholderia cepacia complex TaxID=87882 RepID=UPI000CFEFDEF|nr:MULTISPECIES: HoxN/HupN/NixA family nickel/cobalt transporter [Burkholderia cepacia complex]MBR8304734.1 HoxN/HupN/NixA family nickel/cobalt transporter [Burkholderia dolosa]MDN8051292.1 HoxN/HupN/NixA family nickel/cobalt transporter [Burkholderia multivorans]PRH27390.1 HoxN/HupN/NixA family nickel/cobalt transporter [Burkholderia multivorans]